MTSKEQDKYRASKKWKAFRMHLIKLHRHTCQMCGVIKRGAETRYLQVHHLDDSTYGRETEEDVILLCAGCHKWVIERFVKRKDFDPALFVAKFLEVYHQTSNKNNKKGESKDPPAA